jgi:hypothetical protein
MNGFILPFHDPAREPEPVLTEVQLARLSAKHKSQLQWYIPLHHASQCLRGGLVVQTCAEQVCEHLPLEALWWNLESEQARHCPSQKARAAQVEEVNENEEKGRR